MYILIILSSHLSLPQMLCFWGLMSFLDLARSDLYNCAKLYKIGNLSNIIVC